MKVQPKALVADDLAHRLDALAHGPRISDPDGVRQRDLGDARLGGFLGQGDKAIFGHFAVEGTPERHGEGGGDGGATLSVAARCDLAQGAHLFGGVGALIADAETVGGADHHIGLIATGRHSAIPAAHVEHQANTGAGWVVREPGGNLLRPRHLRHPDWIDE